MIEHKLNVVNEIADKVSMMDHGKKIAEGTSSATARTCSVLISDGRPESLETEPVRKKPLLECKGVNTRYDDLHVLKDVDCQIGEGETVCLLGGNVSGNSTTMKTILGIVTPRSCLVLYSQVRHHRCAGGVPSLPAHDHAREPGDGRHHA